MPAYPFPWVYHGSISPDCLDKCEELFLWFARPLTKKEIAKIEKNCPIPVADFMAWGDRWAYFGSPGDTYDTLVISTYGDVPADATADDWMAIYNDGVKIADAIDRFQAALEAWLLEVHAIVPILFFYGPNTDEHDAWADWSVTQVGTLWDEVKGLEADEDDEYGPGQFLAYIQKITAGLMAEHADPAVVVADLYARDGLQGYVSRLSYQESTLHTNGAALGKALAQGARLEDFPTYVQLAYLASYDALGRKALVGMADPIGTLHNLVEALPIERSDMGTPFLLLIADNLVHQTPAFTRPLKKHARLAARVLALAADRRDANAQVYVNGSAYAEWAKEPRLMLNLAQKGLAHFSDVPLLWNNAIAAANHLGDTLLAARLAGQMRDAVRPDAQAIANESFALVKAGDIAGARGQLEAHVKAKGELTKEILVNLLYTWIQGGATPTASLVDNVLGALERTEFSLDVTLLENVAIYLNEAGRPQDVLHLMDARLGELRPTTALWEAYTWSAVLADDVEVAARTLGFARGQVKAKQLSADVAENLALLHARVGDAESARERLAQAVALGKVPDELKKAKEWARYLGTVLE